jgi:hypothetical protein
VESKSEEDKEHTEVYLHSENDKIVGIAILSAEPRELTVVAISGPINLEDLDKLGGNLGIPHLPDHGKRSPRPPTPPPAPKPEAKPE